MNRPNVVSLRDRDHFGGGPLKREVLDFDFYLAFCEAGFRTRRLRDAQLILAR